MMPSTKGAIALAIVGGLIAIIKMMLQSRAVREAAADKLLADAEVARLRREAEERSARHARDAQERAEEANARMAERDQKEKLIAQLQASTEATLSILRNELKVRDEASERSFEYLDRNTRATERLAETAVTSAMEMRAISEKISAIQSGSGCRADRRIP